MILILENCWNVFKPRIVVSKTSYYPIDFYHRYLPETWLREDRFGVPVIDEHITSQELQKYESISSYYLDYQKSHKSVLESDKTVETVVYGRIYEDTFSHETYDMPLLFFKI